MYCAIFTGGDFPPKERVLPYLSGIDYAIAADSGLVCAASYGADVNLIIGDMDSVPLPLYEKYHCTEREEWPCDKDFSDTELALKRATRFLKERASKNTQKGVNASADKIALIGGAGGQIDHFFALRDIFSLADAPDIWLCGINAIFCIDSERFPVLEISGLTEKDPISVFPVWTNSAERAVYDAGSCVSSGLEWELAPLEWKPGFASLRNRLSARNVVCAEHITEINTNNEANTRDDICGGRAGKRSAVSKAQVRIEATSGRFLVTVPLEARICAELNGIHR